jgi:hypothetical protein
MPPAAITLDILEQHFRSQKHLKSPSSRSCFQEFLYDPKESANFLSLSRNLADIEEIGAADRSHKTLEHK